MSSSQPSAKLLPAGMRLRALVLACVLACNVQAQSVMPQPGGVGLPAGGAVVAGSASITQTATTQTITQVTQKAIIDWRSFSVAAGNSVVFRQPARDAITLNRVIGNEPSSVFGSISANGQIFLVNQNGLYFGAGSVLDTGGLVASALDIGNEDFLAGRYSFRLNGTGVAGAWVSNAGTLRAKDGSYVVLAGEQVANSGKIDARMGTVAMAAGGAVTLDLQGDNLLRFTVDRGTAQSALGILNAGEITAEGGRVLLSAAAARAAAASVVNNAGVIRAIGVEERDGEIVLTAGSGGEVQLTGTLNVSGFRGGRIDVQGENIGMASGAALAANAEVQGNGGGITLFAQNFLASAGQFSARGGANGGDGGFVETSGKNGIQIGGTRVDTSAAKGLFGTWLLDPTDITVTHGAVTAATFASGSFNVPAVAATSLSDGDINANLATTNVTVSTASAGAGTGNISLNDSVVITGVNGRDLTLIANGSIALNNASISLGSVTGGGNLIMQTGAGITQGASSQINAKGLAVSGTGNIDMGVAGALRINKVGTFAANVNGNINFTNLNGDTGSVFNVGTVGAVTGVASSGKDIAIYSDTTAGMNVNAAVSTGSSSAGTVLLRASELNTTGIQPLTLNANVTAGTVKLQAADNLVQSGGTISATNLVVRYAEGSNADSVLLTQANNVGTLAAVASGSGVGAANNFVFKNAGGFGLTVGTVDGVSGIFSKGGDIALSADSAAITHALDARGAPGASVFIDPASASRAIRVGDDGANALALTATELGLAKTGATGLVRVGNTTNTGGLTIAGPLTQTADQGGLSLKTAGTLTQANGATLNFTRFAAQSGNGALTLANSATAAGQFALAAAGAITYSHGSAGVGDATVDTVDGVVGVNSGGNTISLTTLGSLGLNQGVNAGASANVRINAKGFSQANGAPITASGLSLAGAGAAVLSDPLNKVSTLAASMTDSLTVYSAVPLTVGAVTVGGNTTTGISTGGGALRLVTDQLTISQNITTGGGSVTLHPLSAATAFDIGSATKGTAGRLEISNTELGRINSGGAALTLGDVGIDGKLTVMSPVSLSSVGALAFANGSGDIAINSSVTSTGQVSLSTSGAISDSGGASGLAGTGLIVTAAKGVSLTGSNNKFGSLLLSNSASGAVTISDTTSELTLLSLNQTGGGNISLTNSGKLTQSGAIAATGSNLSFVSGGAMALQKNLNVGSGAVSLKANSGGVFQSGGAITASGLELLGSGVFNLSVVESSVTSGNTKYTYNDIGTLAASVTGSLSYRDQNTLTLGTVGSTVGVSTNGGALTIVTGGQQQTGTTPLSPYGGTLTIANSLQAGTTGNISLTANFSGNTGINQTGGAITGASLFANSAGAVSMNQSGNHVENFSALATGPITYTDSKATSINGDGLFSNNGNITLNTGGLLSITAGINAGTGTLVLNSTAGARQTVSAADEPGQASGGITAGALQVAGTGPYNLTSGDNAVGTMAGSFNGNLYYVNDGSLTVGSVNGVSGLTSNNAGIIDVRTGSGSLYVMQPVKSAASGARGDVSLVAGGGGSQLYLNADVRGNMVRLNSEGTIFQNSGFIDATSLSLGALNDALAAVPNRTAGPIAEYVLYFSGATVANYSWLSPGSQSIIKLVLYGTTTNSSFKLGTGKRILATNLLLAGFGSYDLSNSGNDIDTLAVLRPWGSASGYNIAYTDVNGFDVGRIDWNALLTHTTALGIKWTWPGNKAVMGIENNGRWPTYGFGGSGGDVRLVAGGSSAITLEQGIATGGMVSIVANGGVSEDPGIGISAGSLKLAGQGSFALNGPNNVGSLAAYVTNSANMLFNNTGNLTIGSVDGTNGIYLTGAGATTIDVRSTGGWMQVNQPINSVADAGAGAGAKAASATINLRAYSNLGIAESVTATGGATGGGDSALVSLQADTGNISHTSGSIAANDWGGATPAAQEAHRARVLIRAGANSIDAGTAISSGGGVTLGTVSADSQKGQAIIDVYAPGGLTANEALQVTGQTAPRINLTTDIVDGDEKLKSSRNIWLKKSVTVTQVGGVDVNKRPATDPTGLLVSGQNIRTDGVLSTSGQYGISLSAQANIDIYADVNSPSLAGVAMATGATFGTIKTYNTARINAKQLGFTGAKDKGIFDVKTTTENLVILGARAATIDNSPYTGELLAVIGRISEATTDPINGTPIPATNSPVGAASVTTGGKLTILSINNKSSSSYNLAGGTISGRRPLMLIADLISDTPGTIAVDRNTEITLRPFTEGRPIVVRKFPPETPLANTTYYMAGIAGLLNEFDTNARLVLGGTGYTGNITVGSRDAVTGAFPLTEQFSLGKMEIAFITQGRVYNLFSVDPAYPATWDDTPIFTSAPWAPAPNVSCVVGNACIAKITQGDIYIQDKLTQVNNGNWRNIKFKGQGDGSGATSIPSTGTTPDNESGSDGGGGGGGGDNGPTDPAPPAAETPEPGTPTGGGDTGTPADKVVTVVKQNSSPPVVPTVPGGGPDGPVDDISLDDPGNPLAPDGGGGLPIGGQFSDLIGKNPPNPKDDLTPVDEPEDPKSTAPKPTPPDDGPNPPIDDPEGPKGTPPTGDDPEDPKGSPPGGNPPMGTPPTGDDPENPKGTPPGGNPPGGTPPSGSDPDDPDGPDGKNPTGTPPGGSPPSGSGPLDPTDGGPDPNDPNGTMPGSNPSGNNPDGSNGPDGPLVSNVVATGQDGSGFSGSDNGGTGSNSGTNNGNGGNGNGGGLNDGLNNNGLNGGGQSDGGSASGFSGGGSVGASASDFSGSGRGGGGGAGDTSDLSGSGSNNGSGGAGLSGGSDGSGFSVGVSGSGDGRDDQGSANGSGLAGAEGQGAHGSGFAGGEGRGGADSSGLSGIDGRAGQGSGLSGRDASGQGGNGTDGGNGTPEGSNTGFSDGGAGDGTASGDSMNGSDGQGGAKGSGLAGESSKGTGNGLGGDDSTYGAQGSGLASGNGNGNGNGNGAGDKGESLRLVGGAQSDSQVGGQDGPVSRTTGESQGTGTARVDDAFACAADRNQETRALRVSDGQAMLSVKGAGVRLARGSCGDAGSKSNNN